MKRVRGKKGGEVGGDEPVIGNTGKGIVPRHERSKQAEVTAGLDRGSVGNTLGGLEVADGEQEEGHVEEEEQQEEGDGGAQGAEHEDGGEDEPAREEEAKGVGEVVGAGGLGGVRADDVEAAGGQDDGEGEPEAAVGGERGGTEGVANSHFPGKEERGVSEGLSRIGISRWGTKALTTCRPRAGQDHHSQRPGRRQCWAQ